MKLCPPAMFYLVVSMFALFFMIFQNWGNVNLYCLGPYNCVVYNTTYIFVIEILYILFWTWLLNIICRSGYPSISWFLVLLPFILLFVLVLIFMIK